MKIIYADNAATTKMSRVAIDAMLPYMEEYYGNPSSLYSVGQKAKEALEQARADVAACFNAEAREIYFTGCGTEADNQAIISAARLGERKGIFVISLLTDFFCLLDEVDGFLFPKSI